MKATVELGASVAFGRLATVHRASVGGRAVALKRARPEVPGAAAALRREARILRAVSHPALVPVLDVVDDPEAPAIILGWADGGSLDDLLADGPLGADDLLHLLRPVAGALDALHRAGVAHLDVSPGNVLLAAAGPILIDPAPPGAGTPGFADPVVAAGGPASVRSDVFGLAACAHVALTGRLARTVGGRAAGPVLAPEVAAALDAGLDPDPRRRPSTPGAFLALLEAALTGPGPETAASRARQPRGRPVARAAPTPVSPSCTWPFDRWQEAADDAVARRSMSTPTAPPSRARRWGRLAAVLAVGALGLTGAGGWVTHEHPGLRTSPFHSTRRPPAVRPPSTTTPGGRP
ncbi:MAG: protein kinase [Acidimicrobiales bacterium]